MSDITNINDGGTVGVQSADDEVQNTTVTNINQGGTVGIQGGTVTGSTVVVQR